MSPRRPTFGELLRRHRVSAGLSQEALAEQTGLSVDAVGLLERGARRRPQRHTLDVLADTLALEGEERERFLAAARAPAHLRIAPHHPLFPTVVAYQREQVRRLAAADV